MTPSISPEEFRSSIRAWIAERGSEAPAPGGAFTAERVETWRRWSSAIHEAGFAGITWPVEHGGQGLSAVHQAVWLEEIAAARVPDHLGIIGLGMAGPTIIAWGSDEQKARFLPRILDGSEIWCQGFSEPGVGSDLAAVQTFARDDGDQWNVNGQKVWSSFAHLADWCLLLVRTDRSVRQHDGLSFLLLDVASSGVDVRPLRQITGDPEFNEIFLSDVSVPRESMLGEPGEGWRVAMTTLSHERGTHGVGLAAVLESELAMAMQALDRRDLNGSRPLDDVRVQEDLAEIWMETQALRRANARSLEHIERTGSPGPESTVSKLRWSLLNQRLTALVAEELGAAGLGTFDDAAGEYWSYARLRARGNTIEAGTSEVLRTIVAERVLGLPRSR